MTGDTGGTYTLLVALDAAADIDSVTCSAGVAAECAVAEAIDGERVVGFGCSDCGCRSHLQYAPRRGPLLASVAGAHRSVRESVGDRQASHQP